MRITTLIVAAIVSGLVGTSSAEENDSVYGPKFTKYLKRKEAVVVWVEAEDDKVRSLWVHFPKLGVVHGCSSIAEYQAMKKAVLAGNVSLSLRQLHTLENGRKLKPEEIDRPILGARPGRYTVIQRKDRPKRMISPRRRPDNKYWNNRDLRNNSK